MRRATNPESLTKVLQEYKSLRLCKGMAHRGTKQMKIDLNTFCRVYLVEKGVGGSVVLRSQDCSYVSTSGEDLCTKCNLLGSKVSHDSTIVNVKEEFTNSSEGQDSFNDLKPKKRKIISRKPVKTFKETCTVCCVDFTSHEKYIEDQTKHQESRLSNELVRCPSCMVAVLKVELNKHFEADHPEMEAACCLECLKIFSPKPKVSLHYYRSHGGTHLKLCPICGKSAADLKGHLERIHGQPKRVMCPTCGKEFSSKHVLDKHLHYVHDSDSSKFSCKFCGQSFKRPHELRVHYWSLHLKVKPYKCRHCTFVVTQPQKIYEHCRNVHKLKGTKSDVERLEQEFERIRDFEVQHGIGRQTVTKPTNVSAKMCWLCNEYFEKKHLLQIHELKHLELKPFVCTYKDCQMAFNLGKSLCHHLLKCHGDTSEWNDDSHTLFKLYKKVRDVPGSVLKQFDEFKDTNNKCLKCQDQFPSLAHFYDHFCQSHGGDIQAKEDSICESIQKFTCKCCNLETMSELVLLRHVLEVHSLDQINYENYTPPPLEEIEPKIFRPRQYRCKHCLTYTAVKKFTVHRHIKKCHNIVDSSDNDLMLMTENVVPQE